jgi:flagellar hook-basal body complex protein FliE
VKVDAANALALVRGIGSDSPAKANGVDFARQLTDLLRGANADQKAAEHQAVELAADRGDVVETMVALTKADLSLRTVAEVRNRALEALHEILRLQI